MEKDWFKWEKETNPEEIKKLVREHIKGIEEATGNILKMYRSSPEIKVMVSSDNACEIKFSRKPTVKEINRAVNALRVHLEIFKEEEVDEPCNTSL